MFDWYFQAFTSSPNYTVFLVKKNVTHLPKESLKINNCLVPVGKFKDMSQAKMFSSSFSTSSPWTLDIYFNKEHNYLGLPLLILHFNWMLWKGMWRNIFGTLHLPKVGCTFFSYLHGMFTKIDHTVWHKIRKKIEIVCSLNKNIEDILENL